MKDSEIARIAAAHKPSRGFLFDCDAFLSSTDVLSFTSEQVGSYVLLLATAWKSKDCGLPNDVDKLLRVSRANSLEGLSVVLLKFRVVGDRRYNTRLLHESDVQSDWRRKASKGGREAAKRRQRKGLGTAKGSTTTEPLMRPNLNLNVNKIEEAKASSCPTSGIELCLAWYMLDKIEAENLWKPTPDIRKWAVIFDRILRIDKRDLGEVTEIITWAVKDDFWRRNIRSPEKLRKHYERLNVERRGSGGKGKPGGRAFVDGNRKTRADYGLDED